LDKTQYIFTTLVSKDEGGLVSPMEISRRNKFMNER